MSAKKSKCLFPGLLILALLQIATAQAGQAFVIPPSMSASEGAGSTNVPFGRSVPLRMQVAYAGFMIGSPCLLDEVRFRPDPQFDGAGKRVLLSLHAGTMGSEVPQMSETFAANRGKDYSNVLSFKYLNLPGRAGLTGVEEFPVAVPFDRGFAFDPAAGSLLLDFQIHDQPRGGYLLDSTVTTQSSFVPYGPDGCGPADGSALSVRCLTRTMTWGNPLVLRVDNAPSQAMTILLVGTRGSGDWGGLTLPWDAGVIGAPGCFLSTNILYAPRRSADVSGVADFGWVIPPVMRIYNSEVTVQAIANYPEANPLGLVTSKAARLQFNGFKPVARLFANDANAVLGMREIGVAPIVQLRGQ